MKTLCREFKFNRFISKFTHLKDRKYFICCLGQLFTLSSMWEIWKCISDSNTCIQSSNTILLQFGIYFPWALLWNKVSTSFHFCLNKHNIQIFIFFISILSRLKSILYNARIVVFVIYRLWSMFSLTLCGRDSIICSPNSVYFSLGHTAEQYIFSHTFAAWIVLCKLNGVWKVIVYTNPWTGI